jgi:opacity protein-like surface antigen
VGVGCSYAFTENFSLDLSYRFVGLGYNQVEKTFAGEKQKIGMSPYANEFALAARFTF